MAKPYAVARARSGAIFVTDAGTLKRVDGARTPTTVTHAAEDVGPIAFGPTGDLWFTTVERRLPAPPRRACGRADRHRLRRPARDRGRRPTAPCSSRTPGTTASGASTRRPASITTLMKVANPRGIAVAGRRDDLRRRGLRASRSPLQREGEAARLRRRPLRRSVRARGRPDRGLRRRHERHRHDRPHRPRRRRDHDLRLTPGGVLSRGERGKLAREGGSRWQRSSSPTFPSSTTTGRRPSATSTWRSTTAS